ncbi:MAG: right-handed parallel beta-helix repeat-containing protein [Flavobacteriales bacterium]|nr:right-handed parallel beta-helix repeat-containing protein [Flavobacteriales bacterium]
MEKRYFVLSFLALFSSILMGQQNYYVNDGTSNGDDIYTTAVGQSYSVNPGVIGTSPAHPCDDIQEILDNYDLDGGDTLFIDAGTFGAFDISAVNGGDDEGSSTGYLFILGVDTNKTIVSGGSSRSGMHSILSDSVVFYGIHFKTNHNQSDGVWVRGSSYLHFNSCKFEVDNTSGSATYSGLFNSPEPWPTGTQPRGNIYKNCSAYHNGNGDAIDVESDATNFVFDSCRAHAASKGTSQSAYRFLNLENSQLVNCIGTGRYGLFLENIKNFVSDNNNFHSDRGIVVNNTQNTLVKNLFFNEDTIILSSNDNFNTLEFSGNANPTADSIYINNCYFERMSNDTSQIYINDNWNIDFLSVYGCTMKKGLIGVQLWNGTNTAQIYNSTFDDCTVGIRSKHNNNWKAIYENNFTDCGTCIVMDSSNNNVINGNHFNNYDNFGAFIRYSDSTFMDFDTLIGDGGSTGVYITDNCEGCRVNESMINNNYIGVQITNSDLWKQIANNHFDNNNRSVNILNSNLNVIQSNVHASFGMEALSLSSCSLSYIVNDSIFGNGQSGNGIEVTNNCSTTVVLNSHIENIENGLYTEGVGSLKPWSTQIIESTILDCKNSVLLKNSKQNLVNKCRLISTVSNSIGVNMTERTDSVFMYNNYVVATNYGLYVNTSVVPEHSFINYNSFATGDYCIKFFGNGASHVHNHFQLYNNIFYSRGSSSNSAALFFKKNPNGGTKMVSSNNNLYFTPSVGSPGNPHASFSQTSGLSLFSNWVGSAHTDDNSRDYASISGDPKFKDFFAPLDTLDIDTTGGSPVMHNAFNLGWITDDINGKNRVPTPAIGAFETGFGLLGLYTINQEESPSNTNYLSFNAVIEDLTSGSRSDGGPANGPGIHDTVLVDVHGGFYHEQMTIPHIHGQNTGNPNDLRDSIVFRAADPMDSVIVHFDPDTSSNSNGNYIVKLDSAESITFDNIHFQTSGQNLSRMFDVNMSGNLNMFSPIFLNQCSFTALNPTTNATETENSSIYVHNDGILTNENMLFVNNSSFTGNNVAVYVEPEAINQNTGYEFYGNSFVNQNRSIVMIGDGEGATFGTNNNWFEHNSFENDQGIPDYMGFDFLEVPGVTIVGNTINGINSSGTGIYFDGVATTCSLAVERNAIQMFGMHDSTFAIKLNNLTDAYIYHNSFNIVDGDNNDFPIMANNSLVWDYRGNISRNDSGQHMIYFKGSSYLYSDNNNFWTDDPNGLNFQINQDQHTFTEWKNLTGSPNYPDNNSISIDPRFESPYDLHLKCVSPLSSLEIINQCYSILGVTEDLDGDENHCGDTSPSHVGFDEFNVSNTPEMEGIYSIGGGQANYPNLTDAITDCSCRGISGPVTFNINAGIYDEQISIPNIDGMSQANEIVFQSSDHEEDSVTIEYTSTTTNNFIVELNGAQYITFEKLTFTQKSSSSGRIFDIHSDGVFEPEGIVLAENKLWGISAAADDDSKSIIYSRNSIPDYLSIEDNTFFNGSRTVDLEGIYGSEAFDVSLRGNEIWNPYGSAIKLKYFDAPEVQENMISSNSSYSSKKLISVEDSKNQTLVINNFLRSPNTDGTAIFMKNCDGLTLGLAVGNNQLQIGNNDVSYGIKLENCDVALIGHNSINLTTNSSSSASFDFDSNCSDLIIENNIFQNDGGYAVNYANTTAINSSDYNDLVSNGTLGKVSGIGYANIGTWKTAMSASGHEQNSMSEVPNFENDTLLDLTSSSPEDLKVLNVIPEATHDIHDKARHSEPWLGAHEFSTPCYWIDQGAGGDWHGEGWSFTSGGACVEGKAPTAGDKVYFDDNSFNNIHELLEINQDVHVLELHFNMTDPLKQPTLIGSGVLTVGP